jgi:DNA-binding response OmpR family regulator
VRILIVEDAEYLASAVAHVLKRSQQQVDIAHDGLTGLKYARSGVYDVVVLDNMLPRLSGVEVSRRLRAEKFTTPIIIISAKSEVVDRIDGLDAGADDYLIKPFKVDELLARIRALTRRNRHQLDGKNITVGNVTLYPDTSSISTPLGTESLTAKELLLFEQLATHYGKIISKEALFRRAWGHELFSEDTYVEVYISYLRGKLKKLSAVITIKAVRGLGYMMKEVET